MGAHHRPALDGLRTVAVYAVVLFHAGVGGATGGFIGVDLFFVLSGYLVTLSLLRNRSGRRLGLARFYARRSRRLLPAALVMVATTLVLTPRFLPPTAADRVLDDARATLLYVANWRFVATETDYFGETSVPSPLLHMWSLAVEEQFYLVFPLALAGLLALGARVRRDILPIGLAVLAIASLATLWWFADQPTRAYYGTDTRLYQLLAGALLAVSPVPRLAAQAARAAGAARRAGASQALALLAFAVLASSLVDLSPAVRGVGAAIVAVVLIGLLEVAPSSGTARALACRPVEYLGRISYATYLWHWPLIVFAAARTSLGPWALAALSAVGSTALAALSQVAVERPVRRPGWLDGRPRRVVAGGVAAVVAGALVVPTVWSAVGGEPTTTHVGGAGTPEATTVRLDVDAIRSDHPPTPRCVGRAAEACVVVDGARPGIHVVGDSHGLSLLPALEEVARERGLMLSATVLGGCPWQEQVLYGVTAEHDDRCLAERPDWYARVIPALDPALVVAVQRSYDDPVSPIPISRLDGSRPDDPRALLAEASATTVHHLRAAGRQVVLVEPVPIVDPADDPLDCLLTEDAAEVCAFTATASPLPYEQAIRSLAEETDGVWAVDLDDVVCPALPRCDPIVGPHVVRRDGDHLTATFARSIAELVAARLHDAGVPMGGEAPH